MAAWLTVTLLTEAHAPDKTTAAFAADLSNWLPKLVDAASGIKLLSCWACKLPLLLLLLWCDGLDTDPWPLSRSCQCSVIRIVFICVPIKKNCDLFHWSWWPKTTGNNVLKPKPEHLINFRFFFLLYYLLFTNNFKQTVAWDDSVTCSTIYIVVETLAKENNWTSFLSNAVEGVESIFVALGKKINLKILK